MIKITVDTQKEYDQVMKTCQYIHDYSVFIRGMSKKTKVEVIRQFGNDRKNLRPESVRMRPDKGSRMLGFSLDHNLYEDYPFLDILAHGIADQDDPKVRDRYLEIRKREEK